MEPERFKNLSDIVRKARGSFVVTVVVAVVVVAVLMVVVVAAVTKSSL